MVLAGIALWQERVAYELAVISVASFFGFGTTVIFSSAVLGENITLGTWEIALWMIYLNAAAAFLYAYNLDLLEKLPWIGPYLRRCRKNAALILEQHKWIRRLAAVGVGLFVMTPLPFSGQLGGCFVGRLIGLERRVTFLVVTLAGTIVCVGYALFGSYIGGLLDDHDVQVWIRVVGAVVLIVTLWLLFKMLRYLGREDMEPVVKAKADAEPSDEPDETPEGEALPAADQD